MTKQQATHFLAEKAMGWKLIDGSECAVVFAKDRMIEMTNDLGNTWNPFTDANHAIEVLEAMRAKGWKYALSESLNGTHMAVFYSDVFTSESAEGDTPIAAICRAAVLALGGEVVDA